MTLSPLTLDMLDHEGPKPDYETSYRLSAWIESHRRAIGLATRTGIPSHFDPVGTALRGESHGARLVIGSTGIDGFVSPFWVARTDDWQILIGGEGTDVRHRFFEGDEAAFKAWFDDLDARGLMPLTHVEDPDRVITPMRLCVLVGRRALDDVVETMRAAEGPWEIRQHGAYGHECYNVAVVLEADALLAAAIASEQASISGVGFPMAYEIAADPTSTPLATDETLRAGVTPVPFDFAAHEDPDDHPLTEYAPSVVIDNLIAYARANDVAGARIWSLIVRANPGARFGVGPDGEAVKDGGVDYSTGEMCAEVIGNACHDEAPGAQGLLDEEGETVICSSEVFASLLERRVVDQEDIQAYVVRDGRLYCLHDE